jgi:hypothetical protein
MSEPVETKSGVSKSSSSWQAVKENLPPNIDWHKVKQSLAEEIDWLAYFVTPFEQRCAEYLVEKPGKNFFYEPLLIEEWFSDLKLLLERCLAYRKEARELEISAVKAAGEYRQFILLCENNEELEIAALTQEVFAKQESSTEGAALKFAKSTSDLAPGFAANMDAISAQAAAALINAETRKSLIVEKWKVLKEQEAMYHLRHTSPGNAHNYLERYKRIVELYCQDLAEAISKAHALSGGISAIYARNSSSPKLSEPFPGYLDKLLLWVRSEAIQIEVDQQDEVEYTIVVPLVQPWRTIDSPGLITKEALKASILSGAIPVKPNLDGIFFNQTRLRIKGVGVCFGTEPGPDSSNWHDKIAPVRLRLTVHLPEQKEIPGVANKRRKRPIVIGSARFLTDESNSDIYSGRCCANTDPNGEWTIFIEPLAVGPGDARRELVDIDWFSNLVTDLKLILRVVSSPSQDVVSMFHP